MEIDSGVPLSLQQQTAATVLCYNCGAAIDGSKYGTICPDCLRVSADITEGIQREATLHQCRDCDRWLSPPSAWLVCPPESKELLALCLRKLRGIQKVRLIDAHFLWTEPHSRRLKVRITVQAEYQGSIIQQSFDVEYVVAFQQCPDCAKSYTPNFWRAVVQVRQHVPHKRTFLYLEQLILKHQMHRDTINIKETHEGIDFFFATRNQAEKFVDFLKSVTPVSVKKSSELISVDIHTSTKQYKFSYSAELLPICKDDLVALPIPVAKAKNIPPLVLCHRVGTSIYFMDPSTLSTADLGVKEYTRDAFTNLADSEKLAEFIVLDIEPLSFANNNRWLLADIEVARATDLGVNNQTFIVRSHLGNVLKVGDTVLGYDLKATNFNNILYDALEADKRIASTIPDVVLVKKSYARKKKKMRNWRLKRMTKEESEMAPRKQDVERRERDYELFLRDVEEDPELRMGLTLYKAQRGREEMAMETETEDGSEDEGLRIPMEQLLDEFEDLTMEEA